MFRKTSKILLSVFLIQLLYSQVQTRDIEVSEIIEQIPITTTEKNYYYKISLSKSSSSTYKFVKIISTPTKSDGKAFLYLSTKNISPSSINYDISAINIGENILYVPRTYFEISSQNFFYLNTFCEGGCDYTISFQQVEMMQAERSVRLDFLSFDYEEYLIRFEKSEVTTNSQLMVTASGGAKGHHGTQNNVKLSLFYHHEDDNTNTQIDVNSNTMFNGAGFTYLESSYTKEGNGYYIAKVRGPINTYINFMVRKIGISCDLPIDSKAIYGFLQNDDIDTFELVGHGIPIEPEEIKNEEDNRIFQVSIVVKGDLKISKSVDELCDPELYTYSLDIKDELQAILTFNYTEISFGCTHICIQGQNQKVKSNAYIIEVHEVTDQKLSTIVTEPLVNGYIYTDYLKQEEVRSYRHSKYLEEGLTKYNAKLNEGLVKVALVKCTTFPNCYLDKDVINGMKPEQFTVEVLSPIDNYYTTNVNKSLETNAYGPTQYLLAVLCLTENCKFEVSFSDEEDSLVLREDSRIAHYISQSSTNYYHFKISDLENVKKVFVYLRTISGDSDIDITADATERNRYYVENTKILEFYDFEYTGLYTLNVTGSIGSFYLLSYSTIKNNEQEEEKYFDIGLGVSFVEGIKNGNKKKLFKMLHDKTRGINLHYVATFYPINCQISVTFFDEEVTSINGIFQNEIDYNNIYYNEDYFKYQVNFISFNDDSLYDNKFCLFYIASQEISSNSESIVSEGSPFGFTLTSNTASSAFLYPHSAGESDILIKYNLENNYLVKMEIELNHMEQDNISFSRSSSYVIPSKTIKQFCPNNQVCGISLRFSSVNELGSTIIPINFIIKSKDNVPSFLSKNKLQVDLVADNTIQYYIVDISPKDKGEIVLNFKKGSGIMFAKIVGKDSDPEDNSDWENRVKLPKPGQQENTVGQFDNYKNSIKYDAGSLYKYGLPLCKNGCELYIGVMSTDTIKQDSTKKENDYLEYSIYVRPEVDNSSQDQTLIKQTMIDLLSNEYVTGFIENNSNIHYYFYDVQDDCDSIEIEFQSESCSLYINNGEIWPEPGKSKWELNSKISNTIFTISKADIGVPSLKGQEFRIGVTSNKYDSLLSMMYIFRIRAAKRIMKSIIEVNSNLDTVCHINETDKFCDLVYPLSDFEFNSGSDLFIYAEPDVITDLVLYFNPVISYRFDNMNEEELNNILPRPGNYQKSTENQNIKNFIEITNEDLRKISSTDKPFALISIKSSKPSIINIYTSMREQVLSTSLNPFSNLLFKRKKNEIINFNIKGDQSYNFYITCIEGEGKAYFKKEESQTEKYKIISGSGSIITLSLPDKKDDSLIIIPTSDTGIKFYINENIHPEVRQMDLIKFGFSGRVTYSDNDIQFPIIYYMKIQDEDENINVNLHINDLVTSFNAKDGGNYTDAFDISGYIVDENMVTSMMRSKRKYPPKDKAIEGRYDKSLLTAKLYLSSEQIKENENEIKYLVIIFDKNENMDSTIEKMKVDISIMPFSNQLYNSPYNIYISGNLLKNNPSSKCNYHRLRAGNQEDKYMQIEIGILSSKITYEIEDINGKEIKYIQTMNKIYGKYIGVIELKEDNDIVLKFCLKENVQVNHEASLNYIFKVNSKTLNSFNNYNLQSNKVKYHFYFEKEKSNLELEIPKILNKEGTKAVPATYNIRLYPKNTFDKDDYKNTISFISYYPFSSYIYKILGNDDDDDKNPIKTKIENYPEDKPYIVSIIAITNEEEKEEIFAYEEVDDPYVEPEDKKSYIEFLVVAIIVVVILLIVFTIVIYRMVRQKRHLDQEILRVSKITSSASSFGQNKDPTNEPFIKEENGL